MVVEEAREQRHVFPGPMRHEDAGKGASSDKQNVRTEGKSTGTTF